MAKSWPEAVTDAIQRICTRTNRLTFSRSDLITNELDLIVAEVESVGSTPQQTLSRVLQDLRDDGMIAFSRPGEYEFYPRRRSILKLNLYSDYTREQIHDILAPQIQFTPSTGQWGLQGIVPIHGREGDFVFFVTFGQSQGDHEFDEDITGDGVLSWQSQPRQSLNSPVIQRMIAHDDLVNSIYLLLRTNRRKDYTYLGRLRYADHDQDSGNPVYFRWEIIEGAPPADTAERIDLTLVPSAVPSAVLADTLEEVEPPNWTGERRQANRNFRTRQVSSRAEQDARNRDLGRAGELLVLDWERTMLANRGRNDLAEQVRDIAGEEGDGAGYDILSFNAGGEPRYIEVKTTTGSISTPFFISANEVMFSIRNSERFELARLFEFRSHTNSAKVFRKRGTVEGNFDLSPTQYRARIR